MSKHTPGPWVAGDIPSGFIGAGKLAIFSSDGDHMVASMSDSDNNEANAAHIVRACNAHDELVAVLGRAESILRLMAEEFMSERFTDRYGDGPEMLYIANKARAALRKAEGEV